MNLSALTSSLPTPLSAAIETIADLGFQTIDVPPTAIKEDARRLLESHDLQIGCVALEREMPPEIDLENSEARVRQQSIDYFRRTIESAASLGAPAAYVTPPIKTDDDTRGRWLDAIVELADCARKFSIRLCIEHFPGRLLPTAAGTLALLDELGHEALALLVDVGHCLISREDPAEVIRAAGPRLGYIHFDDNDGVGDLHWPLLTGQLTQPVLAETLAALVEVQYDGHLCLELNPTLENPVENLRRGKTLLTDLLG